MHRRSTARLLPALWLAVLALANLPGTALEHAAEALGLQQSWRVFAPEPIAEEIDLRGRIEHVGGEREIWRVPEGDPLVSQPDWRWGLWERAVVMKSDPGLLAQAARWLATRRSASGRAFRRVIIDYRWREVPDPGGTGNPGPWNRFDLYTLSP